MHRHRTHAYFYKAKTLLYRYYGKQHNTEVGQYLHSPEPNFKYIKAGVKQSLLALEYTFDESSACLVNIHQDNYDFAESTESSYEVHIKNGGVLPNVAGEKQAQNLPKVIEQVYKSKAYDLMGIACSNGPGMPPALRAGLDCVIAESKRLGVPVMPVNHLEAHILSPMLASHGNMAFPYLCLLTSGKSAQILLVQDLGNYVLIGRTNDEGPGESLDKMARSLKLDTIKHGSGGAAVAAHAELFDVSKDLRFPLTTPGLQSRDCDLSFGAIRQQVDRYINNNPEILSDDANVNELCYTGLRTAARQIVIKTFRALRYVRWIMKQNIDTIALCGGVASSHYIASCLSMTASRFDARIVVPNKSLCTDNALMIASAAMMYLHSETGAKSCDSEQAHMLRFNPYEQIYASKVDAKDIKQANIRITSESMPF